jgi:tRNA (cmo5U34)-methyltransferase
MAHPMDDLERMADAWDRMSADYGERLRLAPRGPCYAALALQIPETAQPIRLLDLGCGLGYELDGIFDRVPAARVTCIDISRKMLDKLAQRLASFSKQIKLRHESYIDAELDEAVYDFVISSLTVHHLPRHTKLALFRKVRRTLVPGGTYVELDDVADPERERLGQQWYEEYVAGRDGGERGEWNHNMTLMIPTERALLEESGFADVSVAWTDTNSLGFGRAVFVARARATDSSAATCTEGGDVTATISDDRNQSSCQL